MSIILTSIKNNINKDFKLLHEYLKIPTNYDNYNQIIDGLYLGNYYAAQSKTFIKDKNIKLVINCSKDIEFPDFYDNIDKFKFNYMRISLNDSRNDIDQFMMAISIPKICPIIHQYLSDDKHVYVHCYAGMQRSATIIICYLIYRDFINYSNIKPLKNYYNFLKSKRVVVFEPTPTFVNIIKRYHTNISNKLNK